MTKRNHHTTTPTKLFWLTDLHLDRTTREKLFQIRDQLSAIDYDAALITGDISSAPFLCDHLQFLASACHPRPLLFLLGNHDFYGAEMAHTYDRVRRLCRAIPNLHHLQDCGPFSIHRDTAIVGHHGWADARTGWEEDTVIESPDHWRIPDFKKLTRADRYSKMRYIAQQSTAAIRSDLFSAFRMHKHVVIASHVPPFPSTAKFDGELCGPTHMPHFANITLGSMLIHVARNCPAKQFTVLSGHTHHEASERILSNVTAHVGAARTGHPDSQGILKF